MGSCNLWSVAKLKAAKSLSQLEEEEEGLLQASFCNLEREKMSYLLLLFFLLLYFFLLVSNSHISEEIFAKKYQQHLRFPNNTALYFY